MRRTTPAALSACCSVLLLAGNASGMHPEYEALSLGKGYAGEAARLGQFPSQNVTFLSRVSIDQMDPGAADANDCWGYVSPTGREIAIVGLRAATSFVDITDPVNPVVLATFSSPSSLWRDIKVLGDFAYVVSEGSTGQGISGQHIQIFELTDVDNGNVINRGFTTFSGSAQSHNIVVNEDSGYLYRTGGGNDLGLRAYAVGANGLPGSATSPVQISSQTNLYVHDAQVVTYDSGPYAGREIAFCFSGFGNGGTDTALRIYDVTDKGNIFQLGILRYPDRAYCHQGWLSEDKQYLYMNDEIDENTTQSTTTLHIVDVSDLSQPTYVKGWSNGNTARDHNCYVKGDYLYAANYRSGLRIYDISDRENPVEFGYIDTYPADDSPGTSSNPVGGFDGAWSSYPFFPSGNVIISDIQQGLVIVRPDINSLSFDLLGGLGDTTPPEGGEAVFYTITENGVSLDESSVELVIELSDTTEIRVAGNVANNVASFTMPPLDCLETFTYRIEASTTAGDPFASAAETAIVATGEIVAFNDNAETDPGWSVSGNATDGQWNRGIPVNAGRGDPPQDADGSGRAWLTDNSSANGGNSDVDGGETILTSPVIDASAGGTLRFSYWVGDIGGAELGAEDYFRVEFSADGGTSWQTLRDLGSATNSWVNDSELIGATIPATSQLRLRFRVADNSPGDVVEAGVDAISLVAYECEDPGCDNPADTNGDGIISPADFNAWVIAFNNQAPECDQNGDGMCTPADFNAWVINFNAGCP